MLHITADVWEKTLELLKNSIDEQSYSTWLEPTHFESYLEQDHQVVVRAPSEFFCAWLSTKYRQQIEDALREITGMNSQVVFRVEEKQPQPAPAASESNSYSSDSFASAGPRAGLIPSEFKDDPTDRFFTNAGSLIPRYTFENYVVGESNRFACVAAQAVSEPSSKVYNPLFIYGGTGLGKTHLMHAIGNQIRQTSRHMKAAYITSEQFMNLYVDAISQNRPLDFRTFFRRCDLLLIDDIQFFIGKQQTQIEFFHTFNALYDSGRKIVISSDRPPKELAPLEERLRSRFEWGLIVDIQKPDLETRLAILRQKAAHEKINLPHPVMMFLAEHVTANVRELEGALLRLKAYSSLHSRQVDLSMARNIIGGLLAAPSGAARLKIEDIQQAVCEYFDMRLADLLNPSRAKKFCEPRHIAMYLCRKLTPFSLPDIGQRFGGRDHTSVLHACRRIEGNLEKDSNLSNVVQYLTRYLKERTGGGMDQTSPSSGASAYSGERKKESRDPS